MLAARMLHVRIVINPLGVAADRSGPPQLSESGSRLMLNN
jgi:hypothetical protein